MNYLAYQNQAIRTINTERLLHHQKSHENSASKSNKKDQLYYLVVNKSHSKIEQSGEGKTGVEVGVGVGLPPLKILQLNKQKLQNKKSKLQNEKGMLKIISILNREMSIERKRYFETVNTNQTLVVKGNDSNRAATNKLRYNLNLHTEVLITPKFKQKQNHTLTSYRKVQNRIKWKDHPEDQTFTPWNFDSIDDLSQPKLLT